MLIKSLAYGLLVVVFTQHPYKEDQISCTCFRGVDWLIGGNSLRCTVRWGKFKVFLVPRLYAQAMYSVLRTLDIKIFNG